MDKITYLAQLAEGLARWVPERERQEILRYYAEYFQEAGEDREAEVVAELGDPWALSSRLAVEGGYVSQEGANAWRPRQTRRKVWPVVTVAVVAVVAIVAMSAAYAASLFGRVVGQAVAVREDEIGWIDSGMGITVVEDEEIRIGQVVPIPSEAPVAYIGSEGGFWSMADGYLEPFDEIDVDAGIANVTVTSGDDYTLCISSDATLGGYSLRWEVKDGKLKIRDSGSAGHVTINNWDDFKNMFGIDASAMDVVITVPEGAVQNKLKVKTGLGDVFISGLEMGKKLEAETGLGDVQCYEVRTRDEVKLETGMGDVTLAVDEAYSGAEYDLKTGMGTVEASLNGYETDWKYEAKTGMGTVTVNGADRGAKAERKGGSYELEAETGMGDVNLYFKDNRW